MRPENYAPNRRNVLVATLAVGAASRLSSRQMPRRDDPESALRTFLIAFENCDLPLMESFFAPDATYFDRFPPGAVSGPDYVRGSGMPRGMRELAQRLPRNGGKPPFHSLDPQDLLIQSAGAVAICTFHLLDEKTFGRRTVIMKEQDGAGWKILHIHASNLPRSQGPDPGIRVQQ